MPAYAICTTTTCNLSCVMCPFNGPQAPRRQQSLNPDVVDEFLRQAGAGATAYFSSTGEFLTDPNALLYLRAARSRGLRTQLLTNGQLLTPDMIDAILNAGCLDFRISADDITTEGYERIRHGGKFSRILDACTYLRYRKQAGAGLQTMICVTLLEHTASRANDFIEFWRGKADTIYLQHEYYDVFKMRRRFDCPPQRVPCRLGINIQPSGCLTPCCALQVYEHYQQPDWLPAFPKMSISEAQAHFDRLYNDPESPMRKLCQGCEWWCMFSSPSGFSRSQTY